MNTITIGVIREGKVPPDKRVPLTPRHCQQLQALYPNLNIIVQPSPIRAYKDQEYWDLGITMKEDLSECDILLGVKEVNISDLIPERKYLFFSHTFKKQAYNRDLLKAIIEKKIQLIDYEVLKDTKNKRIIGFGRYAGIVGAYNGFLTYGLKHNLYKLKPANLCADRKEVEEELKKVVLPANAKIVLTGYGRVGHGAREIMDLLPIKEVTPDEFLNDSFDSPVFTHLEVEDYYDKRGGGDFEKREFYSQPDLYKSSFPKYLPHTDMYIPCHYWSNKADYIMTRDDLKKENVRLSVVADISCDIDGPVPSTLRPSKIADPIYGYCPSSESEVTFDTEGAIAVMAVDNLPCELPLDASEDFGNELIKEVFPALITDDSDKIIARGSQTNLEGELTEYFDYLEPYLAGEE
ncbi:MAG: NAD(P)-dependent oxidoreductase [Crocinitomicaceae bacterium]|nr:NAD(P)-dependent oxidoreductase [Crocinitomicaceae bacterium]|tara:strand:- start:72 stop:1292 length:1221 start_codon:yes stop_codon:yes gene_type:complete